MSDIIGSLLAGVTELSVAGKALKDVSNPTEKSQKSDISDVVAGGGFQKLANTLRQSGMEKQEGNSTPPPAQAQQQELQK